MYTSEHTTARVAMLDHETTNLLLCPTRLPRKTRSYLLLHI